jgi:hypothetical protein
MDWEDVARIMPTVEVCNVKTELSGTRVPWRPRHVIR